MHDHVRLKQGETFVLPQIDNIPGFKHIGWNDLSDPYESHEFAIGETITVDHNEVYLTNLEESQDNFMIGGVEYAMPEVGGCINSAGGTTKTGDWWLELPQLSCPELTLNGVELSEENIPTYNGRSDQVMIPAKKKLTIHVRGDNKILPPKLSSETFSNLCALHQVLGGYDSQVIMDLGAGSTLTVQGRPGQQSTLLEFGASPLTLQGSGKLRLVQEHIKDDLIYAYYVVVTIRDHAIMEYDATHVHTTSWYDYCVIQNTIISEQGTLLYKSDELNTRLSSNWNSLPADSSMHITAGPSPDGRNTRTLTFEELLEQQDCIRYIKISPEPVPIHVPSYPIWLGNVQVTDANKDDILGDSKASYDPASSTLNVNNVQVTAPGGKIPAAFSALTYTGKNLTINNSGNSLFTGAASGPNSIGFFHSGPSGLDLQIKGDGVLRFAGDSRADQSYGGTALSNSVNIDGYVKMELLGKTCFFGSDELWSQLNISPTGNVLCSDNLSGSNPTNWGDSHSPYGIPYALFYHPNVKEIWIDYQLPGDNWRYLNFLVPIIDLNKIFTGISIDLRPRAIDQMDREIDTSAISDQFSWAISGEMSSANLEENFNNWVQAYLALENNTLHIGGTIDPCYIGLELLHIPTGKKIAKPAFLVSNNFCEKITVTVKPEYADKVYREGDDFDFKSLLVTRSYSDVPSDRHPEAFQCNHYYYFTDSLNMEAGQESIVILYKEVNVNDQKHEIEYTIPVTVLSGCKIEKDSNSILVTSPTASTLIIATYDSQGRMTDLNTYAIPADTKDRSFAFASGQKAFLIDEENAPLCAAIT